MKDEEEGRMWNAEWGDAESLGRMAWALARAGCHCARSSRSMFGGVIRHNGKWDDGKWKMGPSVAGLGEMIVIGGCGRFEAWREAQGAVGAKCPLSVLERPGAYGGGPPGRRRVWELPLLVFNSGALPDICWRRPSGEMALGREIACLPCRDCLKAPSPMPPSAWPWWRRTVVGCA